MGYGSSAEEERMLSFSPKEVMTANSANNTNSAPSTYNPLPSNSSSQGDPSQPAPTESMLSSATASHMVSYAVQTWQERRAWTEFYSTRAISRPQFAALSDRFATNLHVYRANYQIIAAFWLFFVLLGTIHTLLVAAALFLLLERWCTRVSKRNNDSMEQKHVVIAVFAALTIIWCTGIGKYAVGSLTLTCISVALHATFHEPQLETEIV